LKYGTSATLNSGIRLNAAGGSLEEDAYDGVISAIHGGTGAKVVTVVDIR
jgi:hypothetical protein